MQVQVTPVHAGFPAAVRPVLAAAHHPAPGAVNPVVAVIVVTGIVVIAYWRSLRTHPYRTCGKCHGDGSVASGLFGRARAYCGVCGGTRMVPRLGTRLLERHRRPPVPRGPVYHAGREGTRR